VDRVISSGVLRSQNANIARPSLPALQALRYTEERQFSRLGVDSRAEGISETGLYPQKTEGERKYGRNLSGEPVLQIFGLPGRSMMLIGFLLATVEFGVK
jgi:hypothetical protein